MSVRVTGTTVSQQKKGRAHFPEALVEQINPPNFDEVANSRINLTYDQVRAIVDRAENDGYGRGAIVAAPGQNYISADVWNWGIVVSLNYGIPSAGKPFEGPITVAWPFKNDPKKVETRNFPDELFLVQPSPTRKEVEEWTKEMKEEFAVAKRS